MVSSGEVPESRAATLALLADGRFPSGGHAHSGGYEAAAATHALTDLPAILHFVAGRLSTTGRTDACLIAAIVHRLGSDSADWVEIDAEIDARIASPALRSVSRSLGRQWLRAGRRIWGSSQLEELTAVAAGSPHQVAAFATVADAAGLKTVDAITVHLHHLVGGVFTSAVRLHGLDPFETQRGQVALISIITQLAREAEEAGSRPFSDLPAVTSPLTDLLAEDHAGWDVRLFQS